MWENFLPVYLRCAGSGWEWRGTAHARVRDPQAFWTRCTPSFIPLRSARDEFCISTLPYVDYTAIWVTALRTRKYPKVCLQVGQLFRRLLQLEEVICFLFLTLVLSLFFFWSTLLLSPAELISWKGEEERLWYPLLSHSAWGGSDWPLSEAPDNDATRFSQHWFLKVFSISVGQMRSRKGLVRAEGLLSGQRDMARWTGGNMLTCPKRMRNYSMAKWWIMLRWSTSSMCHGWDSCINGALLPTLDSKIVALKYAHFK